MDVEYNVTGVGGDGVACSVVEKIVILSMVSWVGFTWEEAVVTSATIIARSIVTAH